MAVHRIHTLSACIQYRSRKNSRTLNNAGSIPDRVKYENRPTPCLEWNATLGTCNATTADSIPDPRGERDLSQNPPPPVPGATDTRQRAENALTRGNRIRKSTLIPRLYPFRSICPLFLATLASNRVFVLLRFPSIRCFNS